MDSKDYYCRLREMQNRLESAKVHIKENVSRSRSRSKSPVDICIVNQQPRSGMTPQTYMTRQTDTSGKSSSSQITPMNQRQITQASSSRASNRSVRNQRDRSATKQQKGSKDRKRDNNLNDSRKVSRNRMIPKSGGSSLSNINRSHTNGNPAPVFYTSLYNGVQPTHK